MSLGVVLAVMAENALFEASRLFPCSWWTSCLQNNGMLNRRDKHGQWLFHCHHCTCNSKLYQEKVITYVAKISQPIRFSRYMTEVVKLQPPHSS